MAERAGFEPAVHLAAHTRFPSVLLKPLGHLSVPLLRKSPRSIPRSWHRLGSAGAGDRQGRGMLRANTERRFYTVFLKRRWRYRTYQWAATTITLSKKHRSVNARIIERGTVPLWGKGAVPSFLKKAGGRC